MQKAENSCGLSASIVIEAWLVREQKRMRFEKKTNVSPDVWQRLPFWVRELLKMLKDSGR